MGKEMKFIVEIFYKKNIVDAFGSEVKKNIEEMGMRNVEKVNVSDLYLFEGNIGEKEVKEIAENILFDRVSQKYSLNRKLSGKKNLWIVDVWYKKGVTDLVAETTKKAISDYGIKKEINVSTGKKYYIYGNFTEKEIKIICDRMLYNSLIQDYEIKRGN